VIELYDILESPINVYMMIELVQGDELGNAVEKIPQMSTDFVARVVARRVASAVRFMHSRNVAHRDLKPGLFCTISVFMCRFLLLKKLTVL